MVHLSYQEDNNKELPLPRALVNKPSIIFADEPTGNLDSKTEADVMKLFKDLNDAGTNNNSYYSRARNC
jgi:ABC-type ATPase involved in cell division